MTSLRKAPISVLVSSLILSLVISVGPYVSALQVSKIEFKLSKTPGTAVTKKFVVKNEEQKPTEVTAEVADWIRKPNGDNLYLAKNSARWTFERELSAGTSVEMVYKAILPPQFPENTFQVEGHFSSTSPYYQEKIGGDSEVNVSSRKLQTVDASSPDSPLTISRSVTFREEKGSLSLKVTLHIEIRETVQGLTVTERFPSNFSVSSIQDGGARFVTVERSCADWIQIQPKEFTLPAGESREVTFRLQVPEDAAGTYWAVIFVTGSPRKVKRQGTTIMAVKRFAIKVYETVPNTAREEGYITGLRVKTKAPPTFEIDFSNEGNTQLEVEGDLRINSATGQQSLSLPVESVPVLPGYTRRITVSAEPNSLKPGQYQALAVLNYGGPTNVGARASFQINPLSLAPIGSASRKPTDPDEDGLYEDINGDGQLTSQDAIKFGLNFDTSPIMDNQRAFDFNGDGAINIQDAYKLRSLAESG